MGANALWAREKSLEVPGCISEFPNRETGRGAHFGTLPARERELANGRNDFALCTIKIGIVPIEYEK